MPGAGKHETHIRVWILNTGAGWGESPSHPTLRLSDLAHELRQLGIFLSFIQDRIEFARRQIGHQAD